MSNSIRVLLADDHPFVRAGIRAILSAESDITLIAEASNGHEARQMSVDMQPDILLLDLRMPGPAPTETVPYVRERCPNTRVLILTAYDDEVYVRRMASLDIAGYVLKEEATESIVRAIRAIMNGETWFSRAILAKLIQYQQGQNQRTPEQLLTTRERQILDLLIEGWDNARIAHSLNLAEQTVRNHLSRIYMKLDVRSRAEAIVWAREQLLPK
ncbi:MAG TPA: response regulator transcription factor [Herpetosiphonaceae bacterium]